MITIAIIGSGPTAIYTAKHLLASGEPFAITIYEAQAEAGKGTPYHQDWNDKHMLANIASIEIPPVTERLDDWLLSCSDDRLARMGLDRSDIDERHFYPRVVPGEFFKAQLKALAAGADHHGCSLAIKTRHKVIDVALAEEGVTLTVQTADADPQKIHHDFAVMATGHSWPKQPEIHPGYFLSPWPAQALRTIRNVPVGIRGTSLSGIDAVVALAVAHGSFYRNEAGALYYVSEPGTEGFHAALMSRKGVLPEADFYYPIPYEPLTIFTRTAVEERLQAGPQGLLDRVFELFKQELAFTDPAYAEQIGLADLPLENFCHAYFQQREGADPFTWARKNLEEAKRNQAAQVTVPWRYAILRMHEIIKYIVPSLMADDHQRFTQYFKPIFVDDYATVPHESIERLLALHEAGKLEILALGTAYELITEGRERGACLLLNGRQIDFPAFIEAMGQRPLTLHDFPFPTLWEQGVIQNASAPGNAHPSILPRVHIGGIALDTHYHPVSARSGVAQRLYCVSLPFMLGQFPFAQGITSSYEMGRDVAADIAQLVQNDSRGMVMPLSEQSDWNARDAVA